MKRKHSEIQGHVHDPLLDEAIQSATKKLNYCPVEEEVQRDIEAILLGPGNAQPKSALKSANVKSKRCSVSFADNSTVDQSSPKKKYVQERVNSDKKNCRIKNKKIEMNDNAKHSSGDKSRSDFEIKNKSKILGKTKFTDDNLKMPMKCEITNISESVGQNLVSNPDKVKKRKKLKKVATGKIVESNLLKPDHKGMCGTANSNQDKHCNSPTREKSPKTVTSVAAAPLPVPSSMNSSQSNLHKHEENTTNSVPLHPASVLNQTKTKCSIVHKNNEKSSKSVNSVSVSKPGTSSTKTKCSDHKEVREDDASSEETENEIDADEDWSDMEDGDRELITFAGMCIFKSPIKSKIAVFLFKERIGFY